MNILKNTIAAAIAALLLIHVTGTPASARSDYHRATSTEKVFANGTVREERADRQVKRIELRYVEPTGPRKSHLIVEFNNGARWVFAPCKFEDSPRCYWDANRRGNGMGDSFVRVYGKTFHLNDENRGA